jgi:single-strand DNA-binding protein
MKTKNNMQLIGYLGKDPVIKQCKNGSMLAMLRLATHERMRNTTSDNTAENYKTIWHDITIWGEERIGRLANIMKGSHIMVEGKLEYRKFPDTQGHIRYYTRINAFSFTDLDR